MTNNLVQLLLGFLIVLFIYGIFMSVSCNNYESYENVEGENVKESAPQITIQPGNNINCTSYTNKLDCEESDTCRFLSADVISSDFANGLIGTQEVREHASTGGRCFVKDDINNLEKSEYCGIFNGLPEACEVGTVNPLTGIIVSGENASCFIDINKKCKNIAERKGTCNRRCGLELGTAPNGASYEATCSCNSDCVNNNSCCSDYNVECSPKPAVFDITTNKTALDFGNLYKLLVDY